MGIITIFRYFYIYFIFVLTFFTSGLIINLIQCILYFTVKLFSKSLYRKLNYYLCFLYYSQLTFIVDWYSGSEAYIYADKNDLHYLGKEHALIILNHHYNIDWFCMTSLANTFHCLGNFKSYMKKAIQYLPLIGWCLFFSDAVFLERSLKNDKIIIEKQVSQLVEYPDPMWLVLCPEGTRFTPTKHAVSLKYARENNLPEFKHHLTPRINGFLTSLPLMREKMGALYDITISLNPNTKTKPTLVNLLFGRKIESHFYIKRIPFESVPKNEKDAVNFLYEMFEKKDKLLESFFKTGDFFATSGIKREDKHKLKPRYATVICSLFAYFVVIVPAFLYLGKLLMSPNITHITILCGISTAMFFLIYTIRNITCKVSSYGSK